MHFTFSGHIDLWSKIRDYSEKTTNLTRLYTIVDNDDVGIHISPALPIATGVDEFHLNVSDVELARSQVGFGIRYEGVSNYDPWEDPWSDGMWNADRKYVIGDAPITIAEEKLSR